MHRRVNEKFPAGWMVRLCLFSTLLLLTMLSGCGGKKPAQAGAKPSGGTAPKVESTDTATSVLPEDIDFEALNLACSQPGTVFRDSVMANIRTANGFKSIGRGVLNVRKFGTSMKTPLEDDAAVSAALLEHFGFSPYCAHL